MNIYKKLTKLLASIVSEIKKSPISFVAIIISLGTLLIIPMMPAAKVESSDVNFTDIVKTCAVDNNIKAIDKDDTVITGKLLLESDTLQCLYKELEVSESLQETIENTAKAYNTLPASFIDERAKYASVAWVINPDNVKDEIYFQFRMK